MKLKRVFIAPVVLLLFCIITGFSIACYFLGIPGYSGSPGDGGKTCATCHGGPVASDTGRIFTNIPDNGFVPGDTYSVTIMLDDTLHTYFEMTSEINSVKKGTFIAGTNTYTSNNNQCILTNNWLNSPSCTFDWIAPTDNYIDSMTFYSAITFEENFETKTCQHSVLSLFNGIASNVIPDSKIFLLPGTRTIFVEYFLQDKTTTDISLYTISGIKTNTLFTGNENSGLQQKYLKVPSYLNNGIYILLINIQTTKGENKEIVKKIVIS